MNNRILVYGCALLFLPVQLFGGQSGSRVSQTATACQGFMLQISMDPLSRINNRVLEDAPDGTFGMDDIRTYPLETISSLIAGVAIKGRHSPRLSKADMANLAGFVVGQKYDPFQETREGYLLYQGEPEQILRDHRDAAVEHLIKQQYPEFNEIIDGPKKRFEGIGRRRVKARAKLSEKIYLDLAGKFGTSFSIVTALRSFTE